MNNKPPASMPVARTQPVAARQETKSDAMTVYLPFASKDEVKLSVSIVQRLIAVKTKSGHNCSEADAIKFIAMCKARALNPFEGDAFLIGFDTSDGPKFSLITAHQAFLKRAELHGEYEGMRSGVVVSPGFACEACQGKRLIFPTNGSPIKCIICDGTGLIDEVEGDILPAEQDLIGAWAIVHKKGKLPMHKRIPIEPYDKGYGQWKVNAAGMIVKCAEADALRSAFPTTLGGLYLREEIDLFPPSAPASSAPPPSFFGPGEGKLIDMPSEREQEEMRQEARRREDAPVGAEPPKAQEAPQERPDRVSTPEPPPEEEKPATGQPEAKASPFRAVQIPEGTTGDALIGMVNETLKASGVTGPQFTAWAQKTPGMCKKDMSWTDLSENKLRSIMSKWDGVGPVVKEIKV